MTTIILGIDPSNLHSAYLFLQVYPEIKPLDFGIINNDKLIDLINGNPNLPDDANIIVAIEGIQSFGMPVGKSVFDTCIVIGRLLQTCITNTKYNDVYMLYRKDEKMCLCNSMKAKDSNIRHALMDIYGEVGVKKNQGFFYGFKKDCWSAMAIAHTMLQFLDGKYSSTEIYKMHTLQCNDDVNSNQFDLNKFKEG